LRSISNPAAANVALGLLRLLRDAEAPWTELLAFIDGLPGDLLDLPEVREQRCLALSKSGEPERRDRRARGTDQPARRDTRTRGLIGGRYKQLYRKATDRPTAALPGQGDRALRARMMLDLNDYYPSSNLPRLYRERDAQGTPSARAARCAWSSQPAGDGSNWRGRRVAAPHVDRRGFDAGDGVEARRICSDIEREGPASEARHASRRSGAQRAADGRRGRARGVRTCPHAPGARYERNNLEEQSNMRISSTSFRDGDYLPLDHVLSVG